MERAAAPINQQPAANVTRCKILTHLMINDIDSASIERALREALAPLPIVVDSALADKTQHQAWELNKILNGLLTFQHDATLEQILDRLREDRPALVLRVRNATFMRHVKIHEALAARRERAHRYLEAAEHLDEALFSLKRCDSVAVTNEPERTTYSYYSIGNAHATGDEARRLEEWKLKIATNGVRKGRRTPARVALLRHLFAAAIHLVELKGVAPEHRAAAISELVEEAFSPSGDPDAQTRRALEEFIKAIIYGIAASGLFHLYHMLTMMNPQAMAQTDSKMFEKVQEYVEQNISSPTRQALAYGTKRFDEAQIACYTEVKNSYLR